MAWNGQRDEEIGEVEDAVSITAETRAERLVRVAEEVRHGTYHVDSGKLADHMMKAARRLRTPSTG